MAGVQNDFRISIIVTVKNEAGSIGRLLDSISAQARLPDEVVVAGRRLLRPDRRRGSRAGARDSRFLCACCLRRARIRKAQRGHPVRRRTYHRLDRRGRASYPQWLAKLMDGFLREVKASSAAAHQTHATLTRDTAVVSGFFVPDPQNAFEIAMSATVLLMLQDIDPQTFLPSSRSVAFTKEAWQSVGGYPEWLDYCEDLLFDFALRGHYTFAFAPGAVAYFAAARQPALVLPPVLPLCARDGKAGLWQSGIRFATQPI